MLTAAVEALARRSSAVFKAISPSVLAPLATIFALLVGFLAAHVWSDADRASTAVNREASSLRAVVPLAGFFPGETEAQLKSLITKWPQMARQHASLTIAPPRLTEALHVALTLGPTGNGHVAAPSR